MSHINDEFGRLENALLDAGFSALTLPYKVMHTQFSTLAELGVSKGLWTVAEVEEMVTRKVDWLIENSKLG